MCIKMNETVNKFLLAGDKFTPETHLEQQPNFIYSTCGTFTRNREIIEKFMQTGSTDFIYKNKVDKACFQHDGYQRELAPIAYKFFDKKSSESNVAALLVKKTATEPNDQLPNELHRQIIKQFTRTKIDSSYGGNIWDVDVADMQYLSKYNKGIKYLLCAVDPFSKYVWVVP